MLNLKREACDDYKRPWGIMGGPCLNCGLDQLSHAIKHLPGSNPSPPSVSKPTPPPNPPDAKTVPVQSISEEDVRRIMREELRKMIAAGELPLPPCNGK